MKNGIFLATLFFGLSAAAQTETSYLSKNKIGNLDCSLRQIIDRKTADTNLWVCIEFNNEGIINSAKRIIAINIQNDTSVINEFIGNLKNAIAKAGNNEDFSLSSNYYVIRIFDIRNTITLFEPESKGDGHTELTKQEAQKLVFWLGGIVRNYQKNKHARSLHPVINEAPLNF